MAKTLVGLYDSLSDAEQVRQELINYGFSGSDIRLVSHDTQYRDTEYTTYTAGDADYNGNLVPTLTELGVPHDDAQAYSEGVRRGGSLIIVESSDEWADEGMEILNRVNPVDIHERRTLWQDEGVTDTTHSTAGMASAAHMASTMGTARPAATSTTTTDVHREPIRTAATSATTDVHRETAHTGRTMKDNQEEITIPIVEEEVSVGKREVERGRVRVHSYMKERPVEEQVRLREETVEVERRPVDRPATEADLRASEHETVEFTETSEEAVVSKRARVVEEVIVRKDVDERTETVRGTERRTEVEIDRDTDTRKTSAQGATVGTQAATARRDFTSYADDYRQHFGSKFASSGGSYTDYEPAYHYGYDLATNERYRDRDWATFEADARRDWEQRHPGSTWERFKDAIRYGWDKVRSKV